MLVVSCSKCLYRALFPRYYHFYSVPDYTCSDLQNRLTVKIIRIRRLFDLCVNKPTFFVEGLRFETPEIGLTFSITQGH